MFCKFTNQFHHVMQDYWSISPFFAMVESCSILLNPVLINSHSTLPLLMYVISGMATMAMAMPTISFGHRSGYSWPKSAKSGHSWSFGHAYNTLTITCLWVPLVALTQKMHQKIFCVWATQLVTKWSKRAHLKNEDIKNKDLENEDI